MPIYRLLKAYLSLSIKKDLRMIQILEMLRFGLIYLKAVFNKERAYHDR